MRLPGGLWEKGIRQRGFSFRPVDGAIELAVAEASDRAQSMPEAVTLALRCSLSGLGGGDPAPERIESLCVADRQFLMQELERRMGQRRGWFSAKCSACGAQFDFHVDLAELPVQEASEDFPHIEVEVGGSQVRFRLPNGADQAALLTCGSEADATRCLVTRCVEQIMPPEDADALVARLTQADLAHIEAAMEEMAPAVTVSLLAACADCGHQNTVTLNPYRVIDGSPERLLTEVHQIARHYHWSEGEILGLSRHRRLQYLRLIDRARGMSD